MYKRIRPKAEKIAIIAFPLSSEPIFGPTIPLLKIKSIIFSGTLFEKAS